MRFDLKCLTLIIVVFFTAGCAVESPADAPASISPLDTPDLPARGYYLGFLVVPAEGQSFEDAYVQAAEFAEFVPIWGRPSPFYELAGDLSGDWGNTFVTELTRGNDLIPLVHLSFIDEGMTLMMPPGMEEAALSDPGWRAAYQAAALDVVRAVRPAYLSLGNEVNRWVEKYGANPGDPNGFQHYISLYEEIYAAVKTLSPQTQVFCTFAREIVDENREADLSILEAFDPAVLDLLVFTSYPFSLPEISHPDDLPDDYYSRIMSIYPGKRFGFSEASWPALDFFGGEQGQADFLHALAGRLTIEQGMDLHLLGWTWQHDLNSEDVYGLIQRDGREKLVYRAWKELAGSD